MIRQCLVNQNRTKLNVNNIFSTLPFQMRFLVLPKYNVFVEFVESGTERGLCRKVITQIACLST
jgi:hypothetical protein